MITRYLVNTGWGHEISQEVSKVTPHQKKNQQNPTTSSLGLCAGASFRISSMADTERPCRGDDQPVEQWKQSAPLWCHACLHFNLSKVCRSFLQDVHDRARCFVSTLWSPSAEPDTLLSILSKNKSYCQGSQGRPAVQRVTSPFSFRRRHTAISRQVVLVSMSAGAEDTGHPWPSQASS